MISSYGAYMKPVFGSLKSSDGTPPGLSSNQTQRNQLESDVSKWVLETPWIRSRIAVDMWDGEAEMIVYNQGLGYIETQLMVLVPKASGAFVTTGERAGFKTDVTTILNHYSSTKWVIVNNEEQHETNHSGPMTDYVNNELKAVWEVAHPMGIKVSNGGILDSLPLFIETYRYLQTKYNQATADTYGAMRLTPGQINFAKDPVTYPNQGWQDKIDAMYVVLNDGRPYMDFLNIHYYEEPGPRGGPLDPNITTIKPNVLRYQTEYLTEHTGKALITNECGIRGNSQPTLATNFFKDMIRLRLKHIQLYDGIGGNASVPFTNDLTAAILPNGQAFVAVHKTIQA